MIRFAGGYTKRANSVNPLYPSTINVQDKVHFCEELYRAKKLPLVFKMTSTSQPDGLDERLSANGFRKDSPTSVQAVELATNAWQLSPDVMIEETLSAMWLQSFCHMSAVLDRDRETLRHILWNIVPRHCFVSIQADNQLIAGGLGVLQADSIGLFDIVTAPAFRGCGYGRKIINAILAWGKDHGATRAYLQVMLNNAPALALYAKLGFVEQYQYWYRIKA
ncbi:MAG: GNAT family N-acetyltransferase [Caldilineaceae bacterium]|nr:GNAT family N-acetyltransferase [Caldilineaceae bacterium]